MSKNDNAEKLVAYINENLDGEMKISALDFVRFLSEHGVTFYKDTCDCWKDKIYYWVKFDDVCVCFIAIKDPDEPKNSWTVWSAESPCYENDSVSDEIKRIGWHYVDRCGMCGGGGACAGGNEKIVFGKKFPRVCCCTFRIDNAKQSEILFLKTMVELHINELLNKHA